jgi:CMP-N-acetylneuraminic acid synthetase
MNVLGLVMARGGSKGIPRKNIRLLAGKPLLHYTAEAALRSQRLSAVILSTEDAEIAAIGRQCGLEVPFMRPAALAADDTPGFDVVRHAVTSLEAQGRRFDAVCILQPTSPLRRPEDIDACIELLDREEADAVVTALRVPDEHNPHWVFFAGADGSLHLSTGETSIIARRQELPPAYHREGSVYVARRDTIMVAGNLYGTRLIAYVIDARRSVNLDDLEDWQRAEEMLAAGNIPVAVEH